MSTWHIREVGNSTKELFHPIGQWACLPGVFSVANFATSGQVGPGCVRKAAEQARGKGKQHSFMVSALAPVSRFLPGAPALASLLQIITCRLKSTFSSSSCFWSWCFIRAREKPTSTVNFLENHKQTSLVIISSISTTNRLMFLSVWPR